MPKSGHTGQYESEWSIEISKGCFCGGLRYLYKFYVLSIEKRKKICFVPAKGTFHGEISISRLELQSMYITLVFLAQQRQNRITIQVFFAQF